MDLTDAGAASLVEARVTAIRTTVVPLPASAWLFLPGFGVLTAYARRRPRVAA